MLVLTSILKIRVDVDGPTDVVGNFIDEGMSSSSYRGWRFDVTDVARVSCATRDMPTSIVGRIFLYLCFAMDKTGTESGGCENH